MSTIQYFSCIPMSRDKPTSVFRFHEAQGKAPERYVIGSGWVEDKRLYHLIASGELTDEEKISEKDAAVIINELELTND